jgi:hypothetical protein
MDKIHILVQVDARIGTHVEQPPQLRLSVPTLKPYCEEQRIN